MKRLSLTLAGASVLVLVGMTGAQAQMVNGTIQGDYNSLNVSHGSSSDLWTTGGSLHLGTMDGWNFQGDAAYGSFTGAGSNADLWGLGGSAFYRDMVGTIGAAVNYSTFNPSSGSNYNFTDYQAFGQYFASKVVTVDGAIGGFSGSGGANGGFEIGGGLNVYPIANLSVGGNIQYEDFNGSGGNLTGYGLAAEYLPITNGPFSIYGGYTRVDFSGSSSNIDVWTIGLKLYLGDDGSDGTLRGHHRHNATGPSFNFYRF